MLLHRLIYQNSFNHKKTFFSGGESVSDEGFGDKEEPTMSQRNTSSQVSKLISHKPLFKIIYHRKHLPA